MSLGIMGYPLKVTLKSHKHHGSMVLRDLREALNLRNYHFQSMKIFSGWKLASLNELMHPNTANVAIGRPLGIMGAQLRVPCKPLSTRLP